MSNYLVEREGQSRYPGDQARPQRSQIMTLQEAAKYLGIHQVTLYRLIRESDIPAIRLRGQWRFKKDHLDAWLLRRTERAEVLPHPFEAVRELPGAVLDQVIPVLRELFVWTQSTEPAESRVA